MFSLTSLNGFSQLINEPTHIQANSCSCIDLILTDQPNLSMNSGVYSSLHPNCHHHIVHSRFNLNIYYPPPYQRLIWDYKKADSTKIRKALDTAQQTFLVFQDVFKTSSETSSRRVCKTSCNYVFKTSWKTKKCYTEDVFSTSSPRRMFAGGYLGEAL